MINQVGKRTVFRQYHCQRNYLSAVYTDNVAQWMIMQRQLYVDASKKRDPTFVANLECWIGGSYEKKKKKQSKAKIFFTTTTTYRCENF